MNLENYKCTHPENEENQEKLPSSIITGELKEDQENQEIPLKEIEIGML